MPQDEPLPEDVLQERLDACVSALAGHFRGQMAGRGGSGFQKGVGYHEASYLYGIAVGFADAIGEMVEPYPEIVSRAREKARVSFLRDVTELGERVFDHPGGEPR